MASGVTGQLAMFVNTPLNVIFARLSVRFPLIINPNSFLMRLPCEVGSDICSKIIISVIVRGISQNWDTHMLGKVGPYELLEELGSGGMATVFRARQESMGRFVAVKVIHQAISMDKTAVERFQREARVIAQLEHPHILPVYDFNGAHDPPYIVMRYLPTGTLKDIMNKTQLPLEDVVHLYTQLCSALDYAHRKGVIHRDIKPSNIMVDGDGNVFLTDFGIARIRDEAQSITGTGFAVGTPGYMAPEQTLGVEIDSRADVYSLGVMLFELVTGRAPFVGDTPMAVLLKHINEPIPSARDINPRSPLELEPILQKALAKKTDERYQSSGELAQALAEVVHGRSKPAGILANIAQETITDLQIQRQDQPSATRQHAEQTYVEDVKTIITDSKVAKIAPERTRRYVMIGAALGLLVLVVGGILFAALIGDGERDNETADLQTHEALLTEQNHTTTASALLEAISATQTEQAALLVVTQSVEETEISEPTATEESVTQEVTLGATASETPILPTSTDSLTETPLPPTPTDTPTEIPTETPTPSNTPSEAIGRVTVGRGMLYGEPNLRAAEVLPVPEGASVIVTGISSDGEWYFVHRSGESGWILAEQIEVGGNLDTIAMIIPSETPIPTATETPSLTPTATFTETPLPTETFTATPTEEVASPTLEPSPTATAIPAGALPFVADMEGENPLANWEYLPDQWQVRTDGGNTGLFGMTGFDSSMTMLGRDVPEWVKPGSENLLLNFRVNLLDANSGGRFIFKFTPQNGYYALEMLSGMVSLRRGEPNTAPVRGNERELQRVSGANITNNRWYEFMIWTSGSRTYVYQNKQLIIAVEDRGLPLAPGGILLQTFSSQAYPVGWDDFIIQRPEDASDHFEGSSFPTTWRRSNEQNIGLGSNGTTQYIEMTGDSQVSPITPPLENFILLAELNNMSQGFEMYVREAQGQGALLLDWAAGHVEVKQLDAAGNPLFTQTLRNYYGFGRPKAFIMTAVGSRITIYSGTDIVLEQDLAGLPSAGYIRFNTTGAEALRIDDFLVAQTAITSTADATFAFDVLAALENRPMRELRWDWIEDFSDRFQRRGYWEGDLEGDPGEYVIDESVTFGDDHRRYYVLQSAEFAAWRRIRPQIDGTGTVFGRGQDRANFRDSADIYVQVFMRLPADAPIGSEAWVGVRSEPTASGGLNQYQAALIKDETGQTILQIRPNTPTDKTPVYESPIATTDWTEIIIVALDDRVAFFNDGRVVAIIQNTELLSGTVTLGVEPNSLAHFDDLLIRDTSVNE